MTNIEIAAKAFNLWMKKYTEQPEEFETEYTIIKEFLREQGDGKEPSYGQICAVYYYKLVDKVL